MANQDDLTGTGNQPILKIGESDALKSLKQLLEKGRELSAIDDIKVAAERARRL